MNEQEQAQAIAEIRQQCIVDALNPNRGLSWSMAEKARNTLLKIVDYQAQKIAEQVEAIQRHVNAANFLHNEISEQVKEIERLKGIESELESVKRMSTGVAGYHINDQIATWDEVGL